MAALRARPAQMSFDELVTILTGDVDFVLRRTTGSHHTFKSPTLGQIHVPTVGGRMIKGVYLDRVCEVLGLDEADADPVS